MRRDFRDGTIIALWEEGLTSKEIAAKVGITPSGVRAAAVRLRMEPRRPEHRRARPQNKPQPPYQTEIILPVIDDEAEAGLWRDPAVRAVVGPLIARGVRVETLALMVSRYRRGLTVRQVAEDLGLAWPLVHIAIFDLRRAGVNLPKRVRQ